MDDKKICRYCQHYKTLNLGRERYCHVWGRKEPMVHDRFFCGWWQKRKEHARSKMDRGPGFVTSPGIDNYPSELPGGKPMEAAQACPTSY